jgi:hypothetical protein
MQYPNYTNRNPAPPTETLGIGDAVDNMPLNNMVSNEAEVTNIVGQIDPNTIIDNLDHALKGEQWNKEKGEWVMNASKKPLVNDNCRGAVISYLDGILNNNTTMGWVDEKRLSFIMVAIIQSIKRMFIVNLEEFGFVPKGEGYDRGEYFNRGTPDSARMTMVANMIYGVCYMVLSRALHGTESKRVFKSLSMTDTMGYGGGMGMPQQKKSFLGKLFG